MAVGDARSFLAARFLYRGVLGERQGGSFGFPCPDPGPEERLVYRALRPSYMGVRELGGDATTDVAVRAGRQGGVEGEYRQWDTSVTVMARLRPPPTGGEG